MGLPELGQVEIGEEEAGQDLVAGARNHRELTPLTAAI